MKAVIIDLNENGFVSVCGVCVGMTRNEAKESLFANGFEAKENQRCVYIEDVLFDRDNPPVNNVIFGIDETLHVSNIQILTNITDKKEAIKFYQHVFTTINMFGIPIVYKDKYTEDSDIQTSLFTNPVNKVHLNCSCIKYSSGEIERSRFINIVTISSHVNNITDIKSIKSHYYRLLNSRANNIIKPITKKSLVHSLYENNKGSLLVLACFGWSILCGAGILLYDGCNKKPSTTEINSLHSSVPSTSKQNVVYICTSLNAKKYHSTPDCRWLDNCSGTVKEFSIEDAQRQGKTPCKGCH